MQVFDPKELEKLYKPAKNSSKNDNGQVTVVGGSALFHGAPLLALITASRIVDMVYFSSPEGSVGKVAEQMKSKLFSFIWVPWEEIEDYIQKSDAVLIGPGFLRFGKRGEGEETEEITKKFLLKFPGKKWVIDAGSLQILDPNWIPPNSILTPNQKEFDLLFCNTDPQVIAERFGCIIVVKGPVTKVYGPGKSFEVRGGNSGLTKGGTGDVQAGLTVALLAKNDPFLAAAAASYLIKKTADELFKKSGTYYNSDDLAANLGLYFPQNMR